MTYTANNPLTQMNELIAAAKRDLPALLRQDTQRYEHQIAALVDSIPLGGGDHTIILLAGPSGSGKTTTAHKIAEGLKGRGAGAVTISLDHFYLGQGRAPKHEDGTYDYETVHALDLPLVHDALLGLIRHGRYEIPRFDFMRGARAADTIPVNLPENGIAIVEGIHAMNPLIVETLPKESLRTVYICVEHGIFDGEDQILSPRSMRLIRRMTRDFRFRNSSPQNTLEMWTSVIRGESKYLVPFQSRADVSIDSYHSSEVFFFRQEALQLCAMVEEEHPGYETARGIMAALSGFESANTGLIPPDSLLREFLGGSSLQYE